MNQNQSARGSGLLQMGIILLASVTAAIHIVLAIPTNLVMFYLNALGYIALVVALYLPRLRNYRAIIRWALIAYTGVTVLGWVVVGERNLVAYTDKFIELVLIGFLWVESRQG